MPFLDFHIETKSALMLKKKSMYVYTLKGVG